MNTSEQSQLFRTFITPWFVDLLWMSGNLLILFGAIQTFSTDTTSGFLTWVVGVAFVALIWRVYCEGIVIFFSIREQLAAIQLAINPQPETAAPNTPRKCRECGTEVALGTKYCQCGCRWPGLTPDEVQETGGH